jgi:hypothetical protein
MELTGDSMELKPINTRKLRRRGNEPTDSRSAFYTYVDYVFCLLYISEFGSFRAGCGSCQAVSDLVGCLDNRIIYRQTAEDHNLDTLK